MLLFVALALLFTWPLQFLARAFPDYGLPCMALAGLGPSLAAAVVTRGAIFKKLKQGAPWPLVLTGLFLPVVLLIVAGVAGGKLAFAVPFWGAVIWPPFGEELGWRGYLQPALEKRVSPRVAALGVGLAWAVWHIPTGFEPMFQLGIVGWSFVFAWLLRRARGSVWVAIALHAGINLAAGALPRAEAGLDYLRFGLWTIVAVAACVALPARRDPV